MEDITTSVKARIHHRDDGVARRCWYLIKYQKPNMKIPGSMTEHATYEMGRVLANSLNHKSEIY